MAADYTTAHMSQMIARSRGPGLDNQEAATLTLALAGTHLVVG